MSAETTRAPTRRATLALAAGAVTAASGGASMAQETGWTPPKAPWTKTGAVGRAGGALSYATVGTARADRPPLVLLHKLGGWRSDWRHVAERLAPDRQIFAFDLPGHGDSQWLGDPPYIQSLGETAALLVGAFIQLGLDRVDLVGTSLGGCVAVPLAAFWPERVRKLGIVSSAIGGPKTLAQIAEGVDRAQVDRYDAKGMPKPMGPEASAKTFGNLRAVETNPESNASRHRAGRWIQPSERGVGVADIVGTLKRVTAPTLLLYGDRDPAYVRYRAAAEANLKDGRSAFVANSGAFTMQENPEGTAEALAKFLA